MGVNTAANIMLISKRKTIGEKANIGAKKANIGAKKAKKANIGAKKAKKANIWAKKANIGAKRLILEVRCE